MFILDSDSNSLMEDDEEATDASMETDQCALSDEAVLHPSAVCEGDEGEEVSIPSLSQGDSSTAVYTAGVLLALKHKHYLSFASLSFVQTSIDKIFQMRIKDLEV